MAVAKVIEVTAGSKKGLEDAIEQGMAKASDTLEMSKALGFRTSRSPPRTAKSASGAST